MARYFSEDALATLKKGQDDVQRQYRELQERFFVRKYRTDRAREYALHGFCRRLDELARAVDLVFNLLPPELEDIPDKDNVVPATMLIQSFFLNVAGCLDNLAWIWVFETDLRAKDGKGIDPRSVGLGESYWYVRKSFTRPFRKYLSSRRKWFRHIAEFRDSAAHRIPLYIPPYIISESNTPKYNQLSQECVETLKSGDHKKYDELRAEQKRLGKFLPWVTHSHTEKSPVAVVHYQLLQDYVTVDEFGRRMLEELDRFEQQQARATKHEKMVPGLGESRIWTTAKLTIFAAIYWCFST